MFIGSSKEALPAAYAIQENLKYDVDATVWPQGIIGLSSDALSDLLKAAQNYHFALFVFAPDDILKIRDTVQRTARDNVVFELGLFMGALGRRNCFFLIPENVGDFRIPSDLLGVTPGKYDPRSHGGNIVAALGAACNGVRAAIKEQIDIGSLSGRWEQQWTVIKDSIHEHQSDGDFLQIGSRFIGNFVWNNRSFRIDAQLQRGNILTGTWRDEKEGPTYFGAFQLIVSPLMQTMEGQWVGWSKDSLVRSGKWLWTRTKS